MAAASTTQPNGTGISIKARLAKLVIICVLPGWIVAALLSTYLYQLERGNMTAHAMDAVRSLLRVIEHDAHADIAALSVLATSRRLDSKNKASFYEKAQEVLSYTSGYTVMLSEPSGQQIVNLLRPYGAALPRRQNMQLLQSVLETHKPAVSDLFWGSVSERPIVALEVPVIRHGKAIYGLALGIDTGHLSELLRQQRLPEEWVISLFDRTGTIIAHNHHEKEYVGRKASPTRLAGMQQAAEGSHAATTLDGVAVLSSFSRSDALGWSVAIGVPEAVLERNLRRSLLVFAVGAGGFLLLGLILASVVARRIALPIQGLIQPALALGGGEKVSISPLGLKEADEVAQSLQRAQELLQQRELARASAVAELRESEAQFRAMFEISSVGICESDPHSRHVLRVNQGICDLLGYSSAELLSRNFVELTHADDRERSAEGIARLLQGEIAEFRTEKRYVRKDGSTLWCDVTMNVVRNAAGMPERTVAVMQDIGAYKRSQQELSAAKEAAEGANRAKSTFLANMSHEIRTPLHNILGLAQLLRRDTQDPKRMRRLDDLCGSSQHLLAVINDVLDLSKIEADHLVLDRVNFSLGQLIDRVSSVVAASVREKGLHLVLDVDPALREVVLQGDSLRLGQVLINLVSNSVKFSDQGSITLSVRCVAELDRTALTLRFSVRDTGIGISKADQNRLFIAFEQIDNSSVRKYGGTGLGLTISDRLVRAMGGAIEVESEPGSGSAFSFELGFARGSRVDDDDEQEEEMPTAISFSGSLVLVAEDHPLSRELMQQMLLELGCSVDLVRNGAEAVERARVGSYDLILMDVQMPVLDGLAATRLIREMPEHRSTPILAVTANAFVEDREQCTAAGMSGHLTKPLSITRLAQVLSHWLAPAYDADGSIDARGDSSVPDRHSNFQPPAKGMLSGAMGKVLTREYVLSEFLRLHGGDLARVAEHIAGGDTDAARKLVHNLEGAAAMVGLWKVRDKVTELAAALRNGADSSETGRRIEACEAEFASLAV